MFKSKVVVVTGSSGGFGASAAIRFAQEGASGVVIHGRRVDKLNEVKKKCELAGQGKLKVLTVVGDVREESVRENIVNQTIAEFGRLDILINNAGVLIPDPEDGPSMDGFDELMAVNVRSVMALTQLAIPHLIKSSGNIVNISSFVSVKYIPRTCSYSMSKAALDTFTKHVAIDLGPKGVRVNSVNPGSIPETDLIVRQGMDNVHAREAPKIYPLRRVGKTHEVVDAICYLASSSASFVTGASLVVDGGHAAQ